MDVVPDSNRFLADFLSGESEWMQVSSGFASVRCSKVSPSLLDTKVMVESTIRAASLSASALKSARQTVPPSIPSSGCSSTAKPPVVQDSVDV